MGGDRLKVSTRELKVSNKLELWDFLSRLNSFSEQLGFKVQRIWGQSISVTDGKIQNPMTPCEKIRDTNPPAFYLLSSPNNEDILLSLGKWEEDTYGDSFGDNFNHHHIAVLRALRAGEVQAVLTFYHNHQKHSYSQVLSDASESREGKLIIEGEDKFLEDFAASLK